MFPTRRRSVHLRSFPEAGIAAGVRRIEALTGEGLMAYYQDTEKELHAAAKTAKTTPGRASEEDRDDVRGDQGSPF